MTEQSRPIKLWLLGGVVVLLLCVLLALHVFELWKVITPDTPTDTLLLYAVSSLNFVAFIVFTLIFVRSVVKLRRERQLGSKIKTRLVVYFITVTLLPITGMAVFSYIFLNRSLEKWFGRLPEEVVIEARKAQHEEIVRARAEMSEALNLIAEAIQWQDMEEDPSQMLQRLIERSHFAALAVVAADGTMLAQRFAANGEASPDGREVRPQDWQVLARLLSSSGSENRIGDRVFERMGVKLGHGHELIGLRERRASSHLSRIVSGSEKFEELRNEQRSVRMLGLSTLSLLTLLPLVAATWTAIHFARGIAKPLRQLAEGANEVARGNLTYRVPAVADAELAMLAEAFNRMTAELEENRTRLEASAAELHDKNLALEERRNYIEIVLQALSTGVISFDAGDRITTINHAAQVMLRTDHPPGAQAMLSEVVNPDDYEVLSRLLRRARRTGRAAEQTELAGNQSADGAPALPVALTATALGDNPSGRLQEERGVVLVMEDLSDLLAAQRAAAWSEVARRMAHEIKNPLTPIQLSAERIRRNFFKAFTSGQPEQSLNFDRNGDKQSSGNGTHNGDAQLALSEGPERERIARVVDDCTQTITREVAGLKAMVDEFSKFARLPPSQLKLGNLNDVIEQAVALYEDRLDGVRLDVRLAHTLPGVMLDAEQMRRVFVNLIDNSVEALASTEGERRVMLATAHDPARGLVLAEVADNGHGIARRDLPRLFQPYFSTRGRGTGLGLAIVQRIITDHGGRIRADAARTRGAALIIELPVAEERMKDEAGRMK